VLVAPVGAVSSTVDGTVTVTVVDSAGRQRPVRVTVGASGDGYVEVRPVDGALRPGDDVVVGIQ
jgi:multidrug efflux pump subunit AcrA (membrane-fusion protein)